MKGADWRRVSRPLQEVLPGFRPMSSGYVRLHEWLAECLVSESSAFSSTSFYIQAFVLPRFVPTPNLYFDFGFRVGGQWQTFSESVVDAVREALPKLASLASLEVLRERAKNPDVNLHNTELRLCIAVLQQSMARFDEAANAIADWQIEQPWETEVVGRCTHLISAVTSVRGFGEGIALLEDRRKAVDQLLR